MARIGIVGYFGWGNYGDELFAIAYETVFKNYELITFHDVETATLRSDADALIDSVDAIVIGGGDLLIPWTLSKVYWDGRYLAKPIHVFGVGVPTWLNADPAVVAEYQSYLSHSSVKSISCRDPESVQWIRQNVFDREDVDWFPDLVVGMRFPIRARHSTRVGMIIRKQQGASFGNIVELAAHIQKAGFEIAPIVLAIGKTFRDDIEVYQSIFSGQRVFIANDIHELSAFVATCGIVVSMKFHGIVAAYAMRIPCIAMSRANKFVNFLRLTGNEFAAVRYDRSMCECFDAVAGGTFTFARHEDIVSKARDGLSGLYQRVRA